MVHPDSGIGSGIPPKVNKTQCINMSPYPHSNQYFLQSINRYNDRFPIFDYTSRELFQPSAPKLSIIDDIKNSLI